jgi:hypothetical protein
MYSFIVVCFVIVCVLTLLCRTVCPGHGPGMPGHVFRSEMQMGFQMRNGTFGLGIPFASWGARIYPAPLLFDTVCIPVIRYLRRPCVRHVFAVMVIDPPLLFTRYP